MAATSGVSGRQPPPHGGGSRVSLYLRPKDSPAVLIIATHAYNTLTRTQLHEATNPATISRWQVANGGRQRVVSIF